MGDHLKADLTSGIEEDPKYSRVEVKKRGTYTTNDGAPLYMGSDSAHPNCLGRHGKGGVHNDKNLLHPSRHKPNERLNNH